MCLYVMFSEKAIMIVSHIGDMFLCVIIILWSRWEEKGYFYVLICSCIFLFQKHCIAACFRFGGLAVLALQGYPLLAPAANWLQCSSNKNPTVPWAYYRTSPTPNPPGAHFKNRCGSSGSDEAVEDEGLCDDPIDCGDCTVFELIISDPDPVSTQIDCRLLWGYRKQQLFPIPREKCDTANAYFFFCSVSVLFLFVCVSVCLCVCVSMCLCVLLGFHCER